MPSGANRATKLYSLYWTEHIVFPSKKFVKKSIETSAPSKEWKIFQVYCVNKSVYLSVCCTET